MKHNNTPIALVLLSSVILLGACSSKPKKLPAPVVEAPPVEQALPQIVETPRGPSLTVDDVLFDFDQSGLTAQAGPLISVAADYLRDNPQYDAIIEGHADNTGDEDYNHTLSEQRSGSVMNALASAGISESRLSADAFGEARPVASNDTQSGRQANRRVEIIFSENSEATGSELF